MPNSRTTRRRRDTKVVAPVVDVQLQLLAADHVLGRKSSNRNRPGRAPFAKLGEGELQKVRQFAKAHTTTCTEAEDMLMGGKSLGLSKLQREEGSRSEDGERVPIRGQVPTRARRQVWAALRRSVAHRRSHADGDVRAEDGVCRDSSDCSRDLLPSQVGRYGILDFHCHDSRRA